MRPQELAEAAITHATRVSSESAWSVAADAAEEAWGPDDSRTIELRLKALEPFERLVRSVAKPLGMNYYDEYERRALEEATKAYMRKRKIEEARPLHADLIFAAVWDHVPFEVRAHVKARVKAEHARRAAERALAEERARQEREAAIKAERERLEP